MGSALWYFARGGAPEGPVDAAELMSMWQSGALRDEHYVWREGMADWASLGAMRSEIMNEAASAFDTGSAGAEWSPGTPHDDIPGPRMDYGYAPAYPDTGYAAVAAGAFAGFWLRFVAWFVDMVILFAVSCLLGCFAAPILIPLGLVDHEGPPPHAGGVELFLNAIHFVIGLLYYAGFEASSLQGTPGKYLLNLQVTDINGAPISFARALARNLLKILSGVILLIGYILAAFTARKQALHDLISDCLVVRR